METSTIEISMLRYIPELVAWAIGVILAVIMVRRGGLKAEILLLVGCSLMLLAPLTGLALNGWLVQLLREQDRSYIEIMRHPAWIVFNVTIALLSLGGLVCLIWAFLARFRKKQPEAA
jgi:positive regulator of sigma E activity